MTQWCVSQLLMVFTRSTSEKLCTKWIVVLKGKSFHYRVRHPNCTPYSSERGTIWVPHPVHLYMKTENFFWNGPPTHHIISCDIIMKLTGSKKERPLMYLVIKISNLLHFKQKSLCPKSKSWQRASRTKLKSIFKRAIFTSFSRLSEQSRIPTSKL